MGGAESCWEDVWRAHVVAEPIRAFRAHHLVVRVYSDQYVALVQHLQQNKLINSDFWKSYRMFWSSHHYIVSVSKHNIVIFLLYIFLHTKLASIADVLSTHQYGDSHKFFPLVRH